MRDWRKVVCERCGAVIETEVLGLGESNADRLIPAEDCANRADEVEGSEVAGEH
jgi:hypothetical protein